MKGCLAFICVVAILLNSCNRHEAKTVGTKIDTSRIVAKDNVVHTDTLDYTVTEFKQRALDCGNRPDSECTIVKITYPVFRNNDILNDSIKHKLLNMFWGDSIYKNDASFDSYAKYFINRNERDTLRDPAGQWKIVDTTQVLRQDPSLTTIYFSGECYDGGAHGHNHFSFINWNTKTSQTIKLSDIFKDGYHEKLTKIAEKIFRYNEKLCDTASLQDYLFKDGKFVLNNNFIITPRYIIFLYNEYEVKSYTEGNPEIDIPYAKIKSLLRPNTVITQYIK